MFALEVEYLMGRVISSRHNDRKTVEWPPHPSRLFSALVAAHNDCELGDAAQRALEWMENLPAPEIMAQPYSDEKYRRDVHDVFVPVNDIASLPEHRSRQMRWFPAFTPEDPKVVFIWPDIDSLEHRTALQILSENVTYLGHSMSPVRVAVADVTPPPTLVPDSDGDLMLRVPAPGRLAHLEHTYALRLRNSSIQPHLGRVARYKKVPDHISPAYVRSLFQQSIVFRKVIGDTLPLDCTAPLCRGVRAALMSLATDPIPEALSGHDAEGNPSRHPHIAVVPLPSIGHRYADGHIMGFAVLIPKDLIMKDHDEIEEAVHKLQDIKLGKMGTWQVEPVFEQLEVPFSLRFDSVYNRSSELWASVTPIVFGHFPDRNERKRLKVISGMCRDIGIPAPIEVRIAPTSAFKAAPMATDFLRPKQARERLVAHAWLRFQEPVQGPVILGAGRFIGLGLCRPIMSGKINERDDARI